jgi:hypothetical protein
VLIGIGNTIGGAMRIRMQILIEGEDGHEETIEEVGCLERGALRPEEPGLTLCEAKQLLHAVQQRLSQWVVCCVMGRHTTD